MGRRLFSARQHRRVDRSIPIRDGRSDSRFSRELPISSIAFALVVPPICDGIWYHAAASYDGTTWRLYLNGNLEAQVVVGAFTPRFDSIQHAALGTALNSSGNAGGAFMGALDEVRIWNVVRNASDIQATMTAPLPIAAGL